MRFGDIRRILDKYTEDCKDCHDDCEVGCSSFYALRIKEDIMSLLDKEKVQTDSINNIPCRLKYKGVWNKIGYPENPENGDCWSFEKMACGYNVIYEETYYYDGQWIPIDIVEGIKIRTGAMY